MRKKVRKESFHHNSCDSLEAGSDVLIKDIFGHEVMEIGCYLYVMMGYPEKRRHAIEAWDRFDSLIHQPACNPESLDKMLDLLERFEKAKNLDMKSHHNATVKHLKK